MVVYLGTTGWDFDFWEDSFYPKHTRGNRLGYYSKIAGFTELRSTFNRIPKEEKVLHWYNNSTDDFIYVVRMLKKITQNPEMEVKSDLITEFIDAFDPLDDKFQMLLLHFPMKFQKYEDSFNFLKALLSEIHSQFNGQILVEAPNRSWQYPEVKEALEEYSACLVGNDRRPIPSNMRSEAVYYLRLLGDRRTVPKSKFGQNPLDRDDDIKYWAEHLEFLDKNHDALFVSIDNHFSGHSAEDAWQMASELQKKNIKTVGFNNKSA